MAAFSQWVERKLRGPSLSDWGPHPYGWEESRGISAGFGRISASMAPGGGNYNAVARSMRGIGQAGAGQEAFRNVTGGFGGISPDLANQARISGRTHGPLAIPPGRGARNPWYRQVNKWVGNYKQGSYRRVVARSLKSPGHPLSLAFLGLSMYQGYQDGGVGGALSAGAENLAFEVGGSLAAQSLGWAGGAPLVGGLAVAGAAAYGTYEALEYGNRYLKRRTRTEMSDPYVDKFGTVATMRQRSLQAMRDSHTNMRSALGNEATLLHR